MGYVIDFNKAEVGSDLWLFAKTVNLEREGLDNVAVLLTPSFEGKVWYEKNEKNLILTIYAIPNSSFIIPNSLKISYRLTAPRFDYRDWTNYSSGNWEGSNLDTYQKKNF
jgi:hypothetical protein